LQARAANDAAPLRHYDWEAHLAPVEEQPVVTQSPTMLDKAVEATRLIAEKTAWLGNIAPRRWAIGAASVAGIAILGGLGLGMTLMFDAPSGDETAAVTASEPVVAAAVAPETQQLAEAPQVQPVAATPQPDTTSAPQAAAPAVPQIQAASEITVSAPINASTALMQPQASPPPPAAPANILETNDARWASAAEPQTTPPPEKATAQAVTSPNQPTPAPQGVAPDASTTGGIVQAKPKVRKPAAKAPAASDTTETAKPASAAPIGPGSAVITSAVKMRAGEDNDSDVVKVLPAKASVQVLSCKAWCKVSYDGTEGYVFKRFLKRG
jgi:hypothetical protein